MADEAESGERTEEATAQRREDFRRQGNVAQSREITSVLFLFAASLLLYFLGRFFINQILLMLDEVLRTSVLVGARQGDLLPAAKVAGEKLLILLVPFLCISLLVGFFSSVAQIGFLTKEEAIQFNFEHINPLSGFVRIFSLRSVIEGIKSLLKLSVVIGVSYYILKGEIHVVPKLGSSTIPQILSYMGTILFKLSMSVCASMGAISALDYGYQRWELEQRMKMTKQEVKEEYRNREGDPQIKARIRRIQREMARKRMMDDVPKADVIITNPTHIAVALKYSENLPAPQLIAMGAGEIAEKIKSLARQHRIPIVENKPLARAIFKTMKIGQVIPRELFNAVAEVLAYVYRLKKKVIRK